VRAEHAPKTEPAPASEPAPALAPKRERIVVAELPLVFGEGTDDVYADAIISGRTKTKMLDGWNGGHARDDEDE